MRMQTDRHAEKQACYSNNTHMGQPSAVSGSVSLHHAPLGSGMSIL